MAGLAFTASFESLQLDGVLSGIAQRANNLRPAFDEVGAMLQASTDLRFEREVDPDGKPWAPLAASTARAKAKAGHEKILQWSGRLRQIGRKADDTGVTLTSNLPYSAAQQFGAEIQRYAQSREIFRNFVETKTAQGIRRELVPKFAKRSKANFASWHAVDAHVIKIPARPFMGISSTDRVGGAEILTRYILGRS